MTVFLTIDKRARDGALQISIGTEDGGYRIAGPKYDGIGTTLLRHEITPTEAKEINAYLKKVLL